jgi:hypothetical protein
MVQAEYFDSAMGGAAHDVCEEEPLLWPKEVAASSSRLYNMYSPDFIISISISISIMSMMIIISVIESSAGSQRRRGLMSKAASERAVHPLLPYW